MCIFTLLSLIVFISKDQDIVSTRLILWTVNTFKTIVSGLENLHRNRANLLLLLLINVYHFYKTSLKVLFIYIYIYLLTKKIYVYMKIKEPTKIPKQTKKNRITSDISVVVRLPTVYFPSRRR